jgi:hypothetical protein
MQHQGSHYTVYQQPPTTLILPLGLVLDVWVMHHAAQCGVGHGRCMLVLSLLTHELQKM